METHACMEQQRLFNSLPDEILALILVNLDASERYQASQVSKRWRQIVQDDSNWRRALVQRFGRLPYERVMEDSWQREYKRRVRLRKQWSRTGLQRRIGVCPKIGLVDRVVVGGKEWAVAVSMAGVATVQVNVHRGVALRSARVFGDGKRGTALATRSDGICWGLASGECLFVHLTQQGVARKTVFLDDHGSAPVLAVSGCLDALAQTTADWRAFYGVPLAGLVASADCRGSVRVWSDDTGELVHLLSADHQAPLVRVTWACGAQYVVAASPSEIFVWHLEDGTHTRSVFALPPRCGAIAMLAGDPFAPEFFVATEKAGVWRMAATDGAVLAEFVPPAALSFATITATAFAAAAAAASSKTSSGGLGRAVPGLTKGGGALKRVPVSAASSTTSLESAGVLRVALSPNTSNKHSAKPRGTRLLVIGDAAGSLFLFDADARPSVPGGQIRPLQCLPRLHRLAVSAIDVSAAILVSSGPNPWINAIQPALVSMHTRTAVILAQLLAARTAEGWARQTAGRLEDRLDREDHGDDDDGDDDDDEAQASWQWAADNSNNDDEEDNNDHEALDPVAINMQERAAGNPNRDEVPGFFAWNQIDPALCQTYPALVTQVVAGDSWLLAVNGTHLQICHAEKPPETPLPKKGRGQRSLARPAQKVALELAREIDTVRLESEEQRTMRIERYEQQRRIENEFGDGELGLNADEQIQYAIWLSANQAQEQDSESSAPASASTTASMPEALADEYSIQGMTEEEQLQYALHLSTAEHSS
ncbi:hypothetical protein FB639_002082 [Coemansia asiatica]|nr:hypothetical protein FB639_002082 [Coemansia asiatica]